MANVGQLSPEEALYSSLRVPNGTRGLQSDPAPRGGKPLGIVQVLENSAYLSSSQVHRNGSSEVPSSCLWVPKGISPTSGLPRSREITGRSLVIGFTAIYLC